LRNSDFDFGRKKKETRRVYHCWRLLGSTGGGWKRRINNKKPQREGMV